MDQDEFIERVKYTSGGGSYVLATLIETIGYTHRLPGQKMFFDENLRTHGTLVGGPLRSELKEVAKTVFERNRPQRKRFDLDKDRCWELGLGRGGEVEVFVEPLSRDELFRSWIRALKSHEDTILATGVGPGTDQDTPQMGSKLLLSPDGIEAGSLGEDLLDEAVLERCKEMFTQVGVTSMVENFRIRNRDVDVFLDASIGKDRLIVFGAGHDTIVLVELASRLGYDVTVVDERESFAAQERFPEARTIVCSREEFEAHVNLTSRTLVVIMSHRVDFDSMVLSFVLGSPVPYVGLLAPPWRFREIKDRLDYDDEIWEDTNVFSPVGLDVGARTPEEMAVSIVGELTAFRHGRLDRDPV